MTQQKTGGISHYAFDCDDNILFLPTPIYVQNTVTKEEKPLSTGEWAVVHPKLGVPGEWEDYAVFDGSFRRFRDIPGRLEPGQRQYFVDDVERAVDSDPEAWKGPAWSVFVYACEKQRPVSIVTARGHSAETIKAGMRVLVDKGLLPEEPNYHAVFPVTNEEVRKTQLDDPDLAVTVPVLKRRAIIAMVEKAVARWGADADLRFGMSDDDPANVDLIIRAMAEAKIKYLSKRFFVINTHVGQKVKLEVFPVDFSVTGVGRRILADSPDEE